jgi:rRNA maturation RNase YbeY
MIIIKNRIKKIAVDQKKLHADAQKVLSLLGYTDFDLGILLTNNKTIRFYNREYRHKDKPTDVLSFPYHTELKAGERINVKTEEDKNLGDLIISLEYVVADAPKWGHTFEQRMQVLLVHGMCHLLGYDHIKDEDYKVMHALEKKLLKQLNA